MTTTAASTEGVKTGSAGQEGGGGSMVRRDFTMLIALLAIGAFFAVRTPAFLSARNLSNLSVEVSITAVLALGMLLIIVPSHVDLSAGSGVGLFGGLAAVHRADLTDAWTLIGRGLRGAFAAPATT